MHEPGASRTRRAVAVAAVFTLAAGDFWRNLVGWWGFSVIAALILASAVVLLARDGAFRGGAFRDGAFRDGAVWRRVPPSLLVFLGLAALSAAWSFYPGASALGAALSLATTVAAVFLALGLAWLELVDAIGIALRWILGLSLVFELIAAVIVRGPVPPLWVDWSHLDPVPPAFYWSRGLLMEGGRIQGIVGNANLLGMVALVCLVLCLACLLARRGSPALNGIWAAVAFATLLLTRSATVLVAGVVAAAVAGAAVLTARAVGKSRIGVQLGALGLGAAVAAVAVAAREPLLALLGRSPDMTNRLQIWDAVWQLAVQRPITGWGWVSYWAPWVEPFDDLVVIRGVTYLQAHNAWLDVFLQLGAVGVLVFSVLVLGTAWRSWRAAVEPGRPLLEGLLPLTLLAALLAQSLAESRLLIEWQWALLVVLAIHSRSLARQTPRRAEPTPAGSAA